MYCTNCGKKIKRGIQFCPNCGELLDMSGIKSEKNIMPTRGKWKWIITVAIVVCVVAGASGIFVNIKMKDYKYDKKIEKAKEYVEQEKYDDAILTYRDSIALKPERETAYLGLAEVYLSRNQPELALEILTEGDSKTKSEEVKKLCKEVENILEQTDMTESDIVLKEESLYTDYIEGTLIPTYGTSRGGRFGLAYDFGMQGETRLYNSQKPPGAFGIHSALETDLDGDEVPELVVVRIASEELDGHLYSEHLYVHVFRMDGDQVIELEQPKRIMRYGIMKITESGNLDVFVKEENGEKYLCVLNCMRSPMMQFSYNMYLDVMQVEGNTIVCRKSVQMDTNCIYDTTDLSLEEIYGQEAAQRKILYQTDESYLTNSDKWYGDLIEPFEGQFAQYVNFNHILSLSFNSDRSVMNFSRYSDSLPLPYDFGFSEKMKGAVDVFRLRAVWANTEKYQYWDYLDYTKKREADVQAAYNAYKKIIDEYREALIAGTAISNTQFLDVNNLGVALSAYSNERIFYGFYDIDSDGTEELLVGLNDVDAGIRIMDIYAYDGSIARKLMYDETMAERSPTNIYEDGSIYKYASGGAVYGGAYFYKLSKEGYAAVLDEQYELNAEDFPDSPYYNENEHLTQEQFDAKIMALGQTINVGWYNIESDEGFTGQAQFPVDSLEDVEGEENQPEQVGDPTIAVLEEQVENQVASVSAERVSQMVVAHYNELLEAGSDASYAIFDGETTETDTQYQFILRYQMSQVEADDIIASGGMPSANKLVGVVTVNKGDGTVVIDEPFFQDT